MNAGDQRAFDQFFKASVPRLVAFISRRSAVDSATLEDIVQTSLIKAVRHLASYRGEAALFTWLTEICRREVLNEHRKARRRPAHFSLDEPETALRLQHQLQAPVAEEPVSQLHATDQRAEMLKILDGLPSHYAQALEAKYGDGLSVQAIARQLGLTEIAAQSVLSRARDAFRHRWRQRGSAAVFGSSTT